jgi:hypothetical protein
VGALRSTKVLSRIRAGGVVVSKARLAQDVLASGACVTGQRKLRIAGLPNRKAASLKKR